MYEPPNFPIRALNEVWEFIRHRPSDWLYAVIASLYYVLNPLRDTAILVPRSGTFLVVTPSERYYTTDRYRWRRGSSDARKRKLRRYTLRGFVELEETDLVVDVGAFIGEFTMAAAPITREVVAIEPDRQTFVCLENNTKRLGNVTVANVLLSDTEGWAEFMLAADPTENSIIDVDEGEFDSTRMETRRLDAFLQALGYDSIDFLKLDAEGAEPEVLRGVSDLYVRKVAVDAGAERGGRPTVDEVTRHLKSQGYQLSVEYPMVYGRLPE